MAAGIWSDGRSNGRTALRGCRLAQDRYPGGRNPDWAIVKDDGQAVYMVLVREMKAPRDFVQLRGGEADKVRCGKRHFEALGVPFGVVVTADEV
ncbi:MAG: hypothetical protein ACOX8V_03025 [Thermoleophilia bacterium]